MSSTPTARCLAPSSRRGRWTSWSTGERPSRARSAPRGRYCYCFLNPRIIIKTNAVIVFLRSSATTVAATTTRSCSSCPSTGQPSHWECQSMSLVFWLIALGNGVLYLGIIFLGATGPSAPRSPTWRRCWRAAPTRGGAADNSCHTTGFRRENNYTASVSLHTKNKIFFRMWTL